MDGHQQPRTASVELGTCNDNVLAEPTWPPRWDTQTGTHAPQPYAWQRARRVRNSVAALLDANTLPSLLLVVVGGKAACSGRSSAWWCGACSRSSVCLASVVARRNWRY